MKSVYIEITNACNRTCRFCPNSFSERETRFMPPDFFHKIMLKIPKTVSEVYFHVMGEPTLHPELETFLKICEECGLQVNLTTNGSQIHRVSDILLKTSALRQINFSVHSLEGLPDKCEAGEVMNRIFAFSERALKERPDLYINYRLWNADSASLVLPEWNQSFFLKLKEKFDIEADEKTVSKMRKSVPVTGRIYLHFDSRFVWPGDSEVPPQSFGTCLALKTHCAVLVDGRVTACCLDDRGQLELGNIAESSFEEILQSPRAEAMRNGFRQKFLVEPLCRKCSYCRRFQK